MEPFKGRIVFFDLEGTLIDEWNGFNSLPENIEKVHSSGILNSELPTRCGLMSWAVLDQTDVRRFDRLQGEQSLFVDGLGIKLDRTSLPFTADDFRFRMLFHRHLNIQKEEFLDIYNKMEILSILAGCDPNFKGNEIFLIDDCVRHLDRFESPTNNCFVTFINIREPLDNWRI